MKFNYIYGPRFATMTANQKRHLLDVCDALNAMGVKTLKNFERTVKMNAIGLTVVTRRKDDAIDIVDNGRRAITYFVDKAETLEAEEEIAKEAAARREIKRQSRKTRGQHDSCSLYQE